MIEADLEVCVECGNLHMEGEPGPHDVDSCAVCDGRTTDVELDDVIGL